MPGTWYSAAHVCSCVKQESLQLIECHFALCLFLASELRAVTIAVTALLLAPCCWQVGSAEGWTPSTFTSSRDKRAAPREQRPEDFMDDEDGLLTEQLQVKKASRSVFTAVVY